MPVSNPKQVTFSAVVSEILCFFASCSQTSGSSRSVWPAFERKHGNARRRAGFQRLRAETRNIKAHIMLFPGDLTATAPPSFPPVRRRAPGICPCLQNPPPPAPCRFSPRQSGRFPAGKFPWPAVARTRRPPPARRIISAQAETRRRHQRLAATAWPQSVPRRPFSIHRRSRQRSCARFFPSA